MTRRAIGASAAVIAALLIASACAPSNRPPAPSHSVSAPEATALPAGVTVELRQSRADVASRGAMLTVGNGTEHALEIGDVSITDPRFAAPARRSIERTSRVAPGGVVDIRVQLAAVTCPADDAATPTAVIHFAYDGTSGVATVAAPDRVPFMAELHARECVQQRALSSASIELDAFVPSPPDRPAVLRLAVTPRTGVGDLRVVGIRETNLLTFRGVEAGLYPLELDQTGSDRAADSVDLPLVPLRCDPHAVQEDKRGTVFRLFVETGGQAGSFDLAASPEMRGEILGWIARWCDFDGS